MKNKRLKLIVLENRNDDIRLIKNIINNSELSFSIKVTNNKKSFKEYLSNFNPDVIISNYKLSDLTGYEALNILKKTGFLIPFIFFTDPAGEQAAVKCLKAGAYDYILKKESAKLLPAIKSSLKNKMLVLSEMQAAGELKRNEEKYRRFIKQNNEGIFRVETLIPVPIVLNPEKQFSLVMGNSVIAECNDYLAKRLGFSKCSDLRGLDINTFTNLSNTATYEKFKKFVKNGYKLENIITSEVNSNGVTKYFLSNYNGIIEDSNLTGIWGTYRDITELQMTENNLRNSEERIKMLFDNLLLGVFQVDVKGHIILANSSFVNLLGYNSYKDVLGGRVKYSNTNEKEEIFAQLKKNNFVREYETVWIKKDGSKIKVKLSASVVRNSSGKIVFIEGVAEDISEKKKYENALIESEERFTTMADTAPVMIWIAGTDKLFFYFNKSWLQFTGGEIINELGNKWMRNIHPEDMKLFLNSYASSFDSRTDFEIVFRLKRHDEKYRWILTRGIPRFLPDGSFTGYVGTAIDITDRKNAEDTLKESEELYKGVVQSLTEGLIITDISNKILFANVRMAEITGYSVDEMVGYYDYKLFFEPYQWNAVLEKNKRRFSGAEDRLEIKMHKKNGDEFWALINDSPYKDSKGKIIGSINTISDISKRKLAEKALRESEEKYRSVVQNVREVIFKTDQAGIITFLNPYWAEITGYELNKCIGRFLFDFIHPDDKKKSIKEFISIIYRKKDFC
ncbi:MAG: PAS domain S-box protein, partial [Ignavibacteriaceae bacterium]|nr:PAS domain S-box protein [Ignavibacteriaceae bacterium]